MVKDVKRNEALNNEPYKSFIKAFSKLKRVSNEKIHIEIEGNKDGYKSGFYIDETYSQRYILDFRFTSFINENNNELFCVIHTISVQYSEKEYIEMMLQFMNDIEQRKKYWYISKLVNEYAVETSITIC